MASRPVHTLILLSAHLIISLSVLEDQCLFKFGLMCMTATNFSSWQEARIECIKLGGDLWVPDSSEVEAFLRNNTESAVWIGGRKTRIWLTDRTYYYRGKWIGCVDDLSDWQPEFNESKTERLRECLQFCSKLSCTFALYQRQSCRCSQKRPGKPETSGCHDPVTWINDDQGQINRTHVFELIPLGYYDDENRTRLRAERTKGVYYLKIWELNMQRRRKPMCQFNTNCTQCVQYGETFLLSTSYNEMTWRDALDHCSRENGTLAKLDWESPMIAENLRKHFKWAVWIGVSRVDWYFINGTKISFSKDDGMHDGCVVWQGSGLERTKCSRNDLIPAACTLPSEITTPFFSEQSSTILPITVTTRLGRDTPNLSTTDTSWLQQGTTDLLTRLGQSTDVKVAVGVSIGVVAVVLLLLLVIWRVRRTRSSESNKSSIAPPVVYENVKSNIDSSQRDTDDSKTGLGNQGNKNAETETRESTTDGNFDGMYAIPHKDVIEEITPEPLNDLVADRKQGMSVYEKIVQDESYDKREVQTVKGPKRYREPPPSYSVIPVSKQPDYDHIPTLSDEESGNTCVSPISDDYDRLFKPKFPPHKVGQEVVDCTELTVLK